MSHYDEFVQSLSVGQARAEMEQQEREDEDRALPPAVGDVLQRMCASFGCPLERVRYLDAQARLATGTLRGGVPLLRYIPEKGRYGLDVEIGVGDQPHKGPHPVWLRLQVVPLRHGGMEFYLGRRYFQLPEEERAFFDHVAEAINQALREWCGPAPTKIGF